MVVAPAGCVGVVPTVLELRPEDIGVLGVFGVVPVRDVVVGLGVSTSVVLEVMGGAAGWSAGTSWAPPAERPTASATMSTATAAVLTALPAMTR
ncbi:hypothetical protein [Amycolatopsis sp.]|uniref:hypothetical protein n=1 Tax=Amycolatopsis sp. TaxID=37632 RepID=UPI0026130635|nr:hypothetical protein [Amycolatopsis sp.]